jgi:hypothetical protein
MHTHPMAATSSPITLRFCLLLLLLGLHPHVLRADPNEDPHTILAEEVLDLAYSPSSLRDSFTGFLNPALDAMKRDGMPDAAREEVRKAFIQWFDEEVKWDEIKPQMVQLYAKDFTEEELRALLAFLDKPLGQKVMAKLPLVMQDGALVGQQYFLSKQDSLNAKLAPIIAKYQKKTADPSLSPPPAGLRPSQ